MDKWNQVPIIIAGTLPYRLVFIDDDKWEVSLKEINYLSYDNIKLHRITGTFDIGLESISLAVGFDGSIFLPLLGEFTKKINYQKLFNTFLGKLLFGGIFFEALSPDEICRGEITCEGYYRYVGSPSGLGARIHHLLQEAEVTSLEAIQLYNPPNIKYSTMLQAYKKGDNFFTSFPKISIDLLLRGITFLIRWEWSEALILIWTILEQVVEQIWQKEIIAKRNDKGEISDRSDFLKDTRNWTSSTRIEMFYQIGMFAADTYQIITNARKARNKFIHDGKSPTKENAIDALDALFSLFSLVKSDYETVDYLDDISKLIKGYLRRGLLPDKNKFTDQEVVAFREIKPIPGYENWGDKEFEKVEWFGFNLIPQENLPEINFQ